MFKLVSEIVNQIKYENPLILNITNNVTMDFVANGLLSLGASPIMTQAQQEIEDLLKLAKVLIINIGTLDDHFIELCEHACCIANKINIPIIFDPVGAGASVYRTQVCQNFLKKYRIAIIRGNASEIAALYNTAMTTKGVDSSLQCTEAIEHAKILALQHNTAICMSGKIDVIIDRNSIQEFARGSHFMPKITGTGCLLSAATGAFHAVHANPFEAATAASIFFSICGEMAEEKSTGPASFKINFLDALNLHPDECRYEKC